MELTRNGIMGGPNGAVTVLLKASHFGHTDLFTQGSGGIVMRLFSDTSGSMERLRVLPCLPELEHGPDPADLNTGVAADLDLIARVFGLNKVQLAEVCGNVTRPTVYAWRSGSIPRQEKLARIHKLRRAALNWERSGFGVPGTAMTDPVIHEQSLFDLLRADPLNLEAIQFAGGRLAMEREMTSKRSFVDPFP